MWYDRQFQRLAGAVSAALDRGEPEAMGAGQEIPVEYARARIEELGSCCLWCDEFFERHYQSER